MSLVNSVILDDRIRISVAEPATVDQPERLQRMIDSSPGVSPASMRRLLDLIPFTDDERKRYGAEAGTVVWGTYQGIRKKYNSDEYIRRQISITYMPDPQTSVRVFFHPVQGTEDDMFAKMEKCRNVLGLLDLLDTLDLTIRREQAQRPRNTGPRHGQQRKGGGHSPYRSGSDYSGNRPFNALAEELDAAKKKSRRHSGKDFRFDRFDD